MRSVPRTSVEQWAVLRAVVEAGSFARAAEHLHRSQSSVSYAVAQLQERLGLALLESEGRRAILTEAGRALLAEAAPLIDDLVRLEERSRFLAAGHQAEIRLLIDSLFPRQRLCDALAAFRDAHPHVRVDLRELVRQTAPDPLDAPFDLAVTVWDPRARACRRFLTVELLAVAHRDHPLHARGGGPLTQATLSRHWLVFIQGQGWPGQGRGRATEGPAPAERQIWHVDTVEAAVAVVCRGLCYGWLPRHLVAEDIAAGRLLPLRLAAGSTRLIPLGLIHADEEQAGPATRDLAGLLMRD
ncbi:transcriptional regulator, LysR family [Methylobacterium sp. 4-46]|uniref:LysR family transcriptional regulator n=1 Tax=unclassified Methylobacterium TaxID=2615210 RepID=UPI000152CBC3|nr:MULTISPECIES: LysR family transcriptional regulator [Methylobacterium]ACA19579.1 transcriptional regulator, LysR family [Methylobacterium sp. 4-46]WFT78774.1 LysR family transcriptional regulator [Methylobacterium nodulans]